MSTNPLDQIIGDKLGENSVMPIRLGPPVDYSFLREAFAILKAGDAVTYEVHESIKYPPMGARMKQGARLTTTRSSARGRSPSSSTAYL